VWTLQNEYEALTRFGSTAGDFGDGKMKIPEAGNGRPDILDEARFNLEFMLKMQVPPGQPHEGMAHQRIHGEKWSAIPTMPHEDPIKRFLHPVSTASTYDLAATAAQGARIWKKLDPAFATRCLTVAEAAFAAARKNPTIYAEPIGVGGGAYGDGDLSDELYWAAAELFITTGKPAYKDELLRSRFHKSQAQDATGGNMGWDHVAALGKISLSEIPNDLGEAGIAEQRQGIIAAANRFVATLDKRGYRVPASSDSSYIWGSNAGVMNAALVLGTAYFFTKDAKYANGAIDCMDYLLGRNPLAHSYVGRYGTDFLRNPHHRVWAHQKDAKLPEAPPGAVSGGPNSMLQDPYIRKLGMSACPPQTCYVDHVESYSTNEVAINWNAPLAWDAAFLDDLARGPSGDPGSVSKTP
jgi:endoglucanase